MTKVLRAIRVYEDDHNLMMELSLKLHRQGKTASARNRLEKGGFANAYHRAAVLLKRDIEKMEKKGE